MFGKLGPVMTRFGIRLVVSPFLVVQVGEREVDRPWVERVRSSDPWRATYFVPVMGPDPNMYCVGPSTFAGHPATVAQVEREMGRLT